MRILPVLLLCGCVAPPPEHPDLERTFANVESSVVTILTAGREVALNSKQGMASVAGIGSGALISEDGKVLTAAHVVQTADAIVVRFRNGSRYRAVVIGSDTLNDVALLQIEGSPPVGAHIALLGDSDTVRVGQRVFIVGAPRGISHTLSVGHISARRRPVRTVRTLHDTELFQTDAAINTGNSGGPMFDMNGRIVGVVSHIISESGGSEGLGFAVTSNVARALLLDRNRFWSGIESIRVSGELARLLNLPDGRSGLLVQAVAKDSPAARIGIQAGKHSATMDGEPFVAGGDIVLEVEGIPVGDDQGYTQLRKLLSLLEDGSRIQVVILRGGIVRELEMTLER